MTYFVKKNNIKHSALPNVAKISSATCEDINERQVELSLR